MWDTIQPVLARIEAAHQPVTGKGAMTNKIVHTKAQGYLDIGCGDGIISANMAAGLEAERVYLIDEDTVVAKATVRAAVPNAKVHGYASFQTLYPLTPFKVDLITSFLGCGYSYSVTPYTGLMKQALNHFGLIILDVATGSDGVQLMQRAGFREIGTIPADGVNGSRHIFKRM